MQQPESSARARAGEPQGAAAAVMPPREKPGLLRRAVAKKGREAGAERASLALHDPVTGAGVGDPAEAALLAHANRLVHVRAVRVPEARARVEVRVVEALGSHALRLVERAVPERAAAAPGGLLQALAGVLAAGAAVVALVAVPFDGATVVVGGAAVVVVVAVPFAGAAVVGATVAPLFRGATVAFSTAICTVGSSFTVS